MGEIDRSQLHEVISARMHEYLEAMRSLDVERVADFYVKDPDFRVYSDGEALDRDGLVDLVAGLGEALRSFDGRWETIEVTPIGDGAALGAARFTRVLVDAAGNETRDWGTVTWVWIMDGDAWRLIHGHALHLPMQDAGESV